MYKNELEKMSFLWGCNMTQEEFNAIHLLESKGYKVSK